MKTDISYKRLLIEEVKRLRILANQKDSEIADLKDKLLKLTDPPAYDIKMKFRDFDKHVRQHFCHHKDAIGYENAQELNGK